MWPAVAPWAAARPAAWYLRAMSPVLHPWPFYRCRGHIVATGRSSAGTSLLIPTTGGPLACRDDSDRLHPKPAG